MGIQASRAPRRRPKAGDRLISQTPLQPAKTDAEAHPGRRQAVAAPAPAGAAAPKPRHFGIVFSFLLLVLAPFGASVYYLYAIAADQYASRVGFAVRSEEIESAQDLLGGLSRSLSGSSSSDTDILYEFIHSQDLVKTIDEELDLVRIFTVPEFDPVFAYQPTGAIEDLVDYWRRMVRVDYDGNTGLIELRVNAFDPDDAHRVAQEIVANSAELINRLSAIARDDATRYAREDLEQAVERLKSAREALTQFRSETRIVDPSADIQGQMGLLNSLQAQLAAAYIELSVLRETVREDDPRIDQARRRLSVIEGLIEQERAKFGMGGGRGVRPDGRNYSTLVGEFERLMVDLEYAEESYLAARNALDTAVAEAQRQSRYLATYARPTMPESSRYPQRFMLSAAIGLFLLLSWSLLVLIYYSLRDRR